MSTQVCFLFSDFPINRPGRPLPSAMSDQPPYVGTQPCLEHNSAITPPYNGPPYSGIPCAVPESLEQEFTQQTAKTPSPRIEEPSLLSGIERLCCRESRSHYRRESRSLCRRESRHPGRKSRSHHRRQIQPASVSNSAPCQTSQEHQPPNKAGPSRIEYF